MTAPARSTLPEEFVGLEPKLQEQLPTFELFFKTFGFKRIHGRVWGLLVLSGRPLSSKEIGQALEISLGATSTSLNELAEWGAVRTTFDSARRCNLHSAVGNTLSIVATVFRRREQVVLGKLRQTTERTLAYVREHYGDRDPRVLTLRSIVSSCEIAEAVMQLVFSSVERALGDSQSILSKAITAAFKVGVGVPVRLLGGGGLAHAYLESEEEDDDEGEGEGVETGASERETLRTGTDGDRVDA